MQDTLVHSNVFEVFYPLNLPFPEQNMSTNCSHTAHMAKGLWTNHVARSFAEKNTLFHSFEPSSHLHTSPSVSVQTSFHVEIFKPRSLMHTILSKTFQASHHLDSLEPRSLLYTSPLATSNALCHAERPEPRSFLHTSLSPSHVFVSQETIWDVYRNTSHKIDSLSEGRRRGQGRDEID